MAKKHTPKRKNTPEPSQTKASTALLPSFLRNKTTASLLLFGLAVLLFANTFPHGFTLDDDIVIRENMFTQEGVSGIKGILTKDTFYGYFKEEGKAALVAGGRYRPFTLAVFALLHPVFGDSPMPYHILTVLLFAALCVVVFRSLRRLMEGVFSNEKATMIAFLTALLFTVHPVHVEVVANIKGGDEIWALIGSLAALWAILHAIDARKKAFLALAALAFAVGVFSKENAFLFVVLIPMALYFFRKINIGQIAANSSPVWIVAAVFLAIRTAVLSQNVADATELTKKTDDLMNNPFLKVENGLWVDFSTGEWLGTVFHTLAKYVQLLFVPYPLTHDYYPRHIEMHTFSSPTALLALLMYGGLMAWFFLSKNKAVKWGIAVYLGTLFVVSNLPFPIGTNMGERFLFMPSVGFCLVLVAFLLDFFEKRQKSAAAWPLVQNGVFIVAAIFAMLTFVRNFAWESNEKLFLTDVNTSGNSAKLQHAVGGILVDKGLAQKDEAKRLELIREGLPHLEKANTIHPTYKDARLNQGNAHYYLGEYDKAIAQYRECMRIAPEYDRAKNNLAVALRDGGKFYGEQKGDLATALKYLNEAIKLNPTDAGTMRLLGVANGISGKHAEAIQWFAKVTELAPESAWGWLDLSTAYGAAGQMQKAQEYRIKALQLDPEVEQKQRQGNNTDASVNTVIESDRK